MAAVLFWAGVTLAAALFDVGLDLAGLAVLSFLADSMLPLAGLDGWAELSPWFYYAGSEPLGNGIDGVHLLVLLALAAVAAETRCRPSTAAT